MSCRASDVDLFFAVTRDKVEQQGTSGVFYSPNRKGKKSSWRKNPYRTVYSNCQQGALGDTSSDSDWAP